MVPNFGSLIVKSGCNIRSWRKSFVTSVKIFFFFAALPDKPAETDKKLFRMNPAYSILHLENQHHGKSCYVGVWGDIYTYSYKLIYIPITKENMLKLPVEIPVGPAGKLSNAVPSFNNSCCCLWARCFACDCWRVVDSENLWLHWAASTCQCVNVTQGITGKGHICPVDNPWINKR